MYELRERIQDTMKEAMRSRDKQRLSAVRLIWAAVKQREVDERITLDDAEVVVTLDKMAKQRRESITQYHQAARNDLVAIEEAELAVIQSFLPEPLTTVELETLIQSALETVPKTMQAMGQVMAILKPQIQGRADGKIVSDLVKRMLQKL